MATTGGDPVFFVWVNLNFLINTWHKTNQWDLTYKNFKIHWYVGGPSYKSGNPVGGVFDQGYSAAEILQVQQ